MGNRDCFFLHAIMQCRLNYFPLNLEHINDPSLITKISVDDYPFAVHTHTQQECWLILCKDVQKTTCNPIWGKKVLFNLSAPFFSLGLLPKKRNLLMIMIIFVIRRSVQLGLNVNNNNALLYIYTYIPTPWEKTLTNKWTLVCKFNYWELLGNWINFHVLIIIHLFQFLLKKWKFIDFNIYK